MPTIAHISDLHLQSGVPERQAQVEPILQKINEMKPDLVVISGDVTDDGWDSIDELKWAKDWLEERIDGDWFAVPGNHDVGNFVSLDDGCITQNRVDMCWKIFPTVRSSMLACPSGSPLIAWQVEGYNSMLFGSGLPAEEVEAESLCTSLTHLAKRDLAVVAVLHSPLFAQSPDEQVGNEVNYWLGPEQPREIYWRMIKQTGVKLICSGHVHQTRLMEIDGVKIAWAPPASGTWVHAPGLPNPPMPEKTGFFLHHLHDDGRVESELVECAPMLKCIEFNPWP